MLVMDVAYTKARQARLLEWMRGQQVDVAVVLRPEHVQWLTGCRFSWFFETAAAIWADGRVLLIAPSKAPDASVVDDVRTYPAKWHSTLRNDQRQALSEVLLPALRERGKLARVAVEFSTCGPHFTQPLADVQLVDCEVELFRLRRRKHADELDMLKRAIGATGKMYTRAREIVVPNVSELTVFNELQAAAVHDLGEMLTGTGNDYQSNARGGPPRPRVAQAGELYILDLGPAYRGYFADNCRAIAVDRRPTDVQLSAWECIAGVFKLIERMVRPGVSCKAVFDAVQAHLDVWEPGNFNHHLGHGIGLFPHEAPHLNPFWDDTFEEGEVFTCEPGLYAPRLAAGIRLENDYLVTASGVQLLSDFPLELA